MKLCWNPDSRARPSFKELANNLSKCCSSLSSSEGGSIGSFDSDLWRGTTSMTWHVFRSLIEGLRGQVAKRKGFDMVRAELYLYNIAQRFFKGIQRILRLQVIKRSSRRSVKHDVKSKLVFCSCRNCLPSREQKKKQWQLHCMLATESKSSLSFSLPHTPKGV